MSKTSRRIKRQRRKKLTMASWRKAFREAFCMERMKGKTVLQAKTVAGQAAKAARFAGTRLKVS